jgi:hypothetical protein
MDALLILDVIKKYKNQTINSAEAGLALVLLGCNSSEASALLTKAAFETELSEVEYYAHSNGSLKIAHFAVERPTDPDWHKVSKNAFESLRGDT